MIIRKAFGVAGAANTQPGHHHYRFAWPSGDWGSLPIEGGIEVAYKAELAESDNPEQLLADIKARLNKVRSPFRSVSSSKSRTSSNQLEPNLLGEPELCRRFGYA